MDLRTGRMYWSVEEARAAGVPESDIAEVVHPDGPLKDLRNSIPEVRFPKNPFGSLKSRLEAVEQELTAKK